MGFFLGIDEAGRGPWAGPLVVAGVCAEDTAFLSKISGLDDSKKLTPAKREEVFHELIALQKMGKIDIITMVKSAQEIDECGIREANRQAMEEIIRAFEKMAPEVWIDGADNYVFAIENVVYEFARKKNARAKLPLGGSRVKPGMTGTTHPLNPPSLGGEGKKGALSVSFAEEFPSECTLHEGKGREWHTTKIHYVIHGDHLIPIISAASIIAKVTRDQLMRDFSVKYPNYGFAQHKGYGTEKHRQAIINYGISSLHRKTYAPMKSLISRETGLT